MKSLWLAASGKFSVFNKFTLSTNCVIVTALETATGNWSLTLKTGISKSWHQQIVASANRGI
ncbi:MAG: hypothetical protein P1U77_11465, partial [Rubripirellula sp.]|nr:hypothetical protein [Rubripirellula sp.]